MILQKIWKATFEPMHHNFREHWLPCMPFDPVPFIYAVVGFLVVGSAMGWLR